VVNDGLLMIRLYVFMLSLSDLSERITGFQGRYMLPDNSRVAVFECNAVSHFVCSTCQQSHFTLSQACSCDITCPNRVSQRPRDVPMEVFRAKGKGWGVRATQFIPKGKVLGLFTGCVVRTI
jgi:hypothetical protein